MDKRLSFLIKSIGFLIFLVILLNIDYGQLYDVVVNMDINYLLLSFLFVLPQLLVRSFRWLIIIRSLGLKGVTFLRCFCYYLIAVYMGNLTPGKLGEFVKAAYITNKYNSSAKAITSVILDRIYDLVLLFGIGYISLFFFTGLFKDYILFITALIFISMISLLFLGLFYKRIMTTAYTLFVPASIKPATKRIYYDLVASIKLTSFKDYVWSLAMTLISWVMYFLMLYYLAKAVHIDIPFWYLVASVSITTILTLIPVSFNGLGTRDAVLILLFSLIGITKETALVFSLAIFIMYLINALPGLFLFLLNPFATNNTPDSKHSKID